MRVIPRLARPLPTVEPAPRVERRPCFRAACRLVVLWLALGVLVTPLSAQTRKIIIDCDPGIDDAMALAIALQHPGFEILGITTTFGKATIEQATKNALRIVELSGRSVPVYRGAGRPRRVPLEPPPDFVHGRDGLGNTAQPDPVTRPRAEPADRFLVDMARAHPGEITIVAVGRLTNLARALKADRSFVRNVREVVLMGGALYPAGSRTSRRLRVLDRREESRLSRGSRRDRQCARRSERDAGCPHSSEDRGIWA